MNIHIWSKRIDRLDQQRWSSYS